MGFTPDGKLLLTGSGLGEIRVWDVAAAKQRAYMQGPAFEHMAFSPERKLLAVPSQDSKILLWDVSKLLE